MRDERLGIFTGLTRYVQMRSLFGLQMSQFLPLRPDTTAWCRALFLLMELALLPRKRTLSMSDGCLQGVRHRRLCGGEIREWPTGAFESQIGEYYESVHRMTLCTQPRSNLRCVSVGTRITRGRLHDHLGEIA